MKAVLGAFMCLLASATISSDATAGPGYYGHHGHHGYRSSVGVYIGPSWGPWYYPPPVYYPPVVIERAPPVYIERSPIEVAPAPNAPTNYWYFCRASNAYYPYVKDCPAGWLKVVPQP